MSATHQPIIPHGPVPSPAQLAYHQDELAAFIHFGPNTFNDREWGTGTESPEDFNPSDFDADQWVRVLKETGFKRLILVLKHHDGFVLYPSAYTDHSVKASPWRQGQGDVLAEVSAAANRYGLPLGFYLSPWDAHHPDYHVDRQEAYNDYYFKQLQELFENPAYGYQGRFVEVWLDGARGEGAQAVTYDFKRWFDYIESQGYPVAIFSTEPTALRWVGNERGYGGDPLWQKVKADRLRQGDIDYLNHGDPEGDLYSLAEVDVSIRPGWFYHDSQQPKTVAELMDIYLHSVGKGSPLLLNIPPDRRGQFAEADIEVLRDFQLTRQALYETNYLAGGQILDSSGQSQNQLLDQSGVWQASVCHDNVLELVLPQVASFDLVQIQEAIQYGQRVSAFHIDYLDQTGQWQPFAQGQTLGYRRLVKGPLVQTQRLRLVLDQAQAAPILSGLAVYRWPDQAKVEQKLSEVTFGQACYKGTKGQPLTVNVLRHGDLSQVLEVKLATEPGTGVHGRVYEDAQYQVSFEAGQEVTQVQVPSLYYAQDQAHDFYLKILPNGPKTRLLVQ